jgi:hypothetical protein
MILILFLISISNTAVYLHVSTLALRSTISPLDLSVPFGIVTMRC